jgi:hypothetical protein
MKYPKVNKSTEILELVTIDAIYQDCIGYYACGHWDSQSFAIAINQEYDLADYEQPIWVKDVKQGYFITAATDIDLPDELIFSQLPHPGYAEVTYVET